MEDFFRTEIEERINNEESKVLSQLTDKEVQDIIEETLPEIMEDDEMNKVITETILWYIYHSTIVVNKLKESEK